jgi:hypothetical protein
MKYRNKTTGEVSTQGEIRRANSNTSFPRVWNADVCASLNIEPVMAAAKPSCTGLQQVVDAGVKLDANGNWVDAWAVTNKFSEYTDEDGVTHTVAEQEAAYTAAVDAKAAASVRKERDRLLSECDWVAIRAREIGKPVPEAWYDYRGDLRQVPQQAGFPHTIDWPTMEASQ